MNHEWTITDHECHYFKSPSGKFAQYKPISMTQNNISRQYHERIDQLEATMYESLTPVEIPLRHYFAKGMYIREVSVPSGTLVTSKIHKTQHPFTLSKGRVKVMNNNGDWEEISAPHTGITQAGTRRVVLVIEDCVWTTYHKYNSITGDENCLSLEGQNKIADRIEGRIIQKHNNELINRRLQHGMDSSCRNGSIGSR